MATTIVPSTGAAPLFQQGGVGAAPGYAAIDRRRSLSVGLQQGTIGPTDYKVIQRAAGANLSVDITQNAGGGFMVPGNSISGQGLYFTPCHASTINEAIATNTAGANPRLDSVYLQVLDTLHDASGFNRVQTIVVTGTVTAGATLDNRSGAGAAPANSALLADVLMPAGATTATTANIRDRRSYARGAYGRVDRTANASAGSDYTITSTTAALIDATNFVERIECTGNPMKMTLRGKATLTNQISLMLIPWMDGATIGSQVDTYEFDSPAAGAWSYALELAWEWTPAAGSHVFGWAVRVAGGTPSAALRASAALPLSMSVEEILKPSANNT